MSAENIKIRAIIAFDSRGKIFKHRRPLNENIYSTYNIVIGGARIEHLKPDVLTRVKSLPKTGVNIVRLCAGSNEITNKVMHQHGTELELNKNQKLWEHIVEFKNDIRRESENTLVGISTIPPVDLKSARDYYLQRGWLVQSKFKDDELLALQKQLTDTVTYINHLIVLENKIPQDIKGIGSILPCQIFLHQDVERTFTKRKADGSKRTTKHFRIGSMKDGIHPSDIIEEKWFNLIHDVLLKESDKILHPKDYV
jgi:hypothetical protein